MKSVKKLLVTLLLICASPALFAYDGYVGGAVGIGSFDGLYNVQNFSTGEKHFTHNDGLSFIGGGQIGVEDWFENRWCGCVDELYTAFELSFLYNSYERTIRTLTDTLGRTNQGLRVKNDFLFGADFKWGTRFCSVSPYIVTGYALGQWQRWLLNDTSTATIGIPASGNGHTEWKNGFKLGAGVRYDVCDCVFFDMQYSYTWFQDIRRDFTSGTEVRQTWKHKVKLNQQRVVFALNWVFGDLCRDWCF